MPATFTLASAIGAQALGKRGVLPTRLSAVDEAASMNVLCVDKTGTLTRSELSVAAVVPFGQYSESEVLMWARLASSDGGLDLVDSAVRSAAVAHAFTGMPRRDQFVPFDPETKIAEASAIGAMGTKHRVVKGAFAYVLAVAEASPDASKKAAALEEEGFRVLGVACGTADALRLTD